MPTPVTLVGESRVNETIAQHDGPTVQGGTDLLDHVLGPRRIHEHRFSHRSDLQTGRSRKTPRMASPVGVPPGSAVTMVSLPRSA